MTYASIGAKLHATCSEAMAEEFDYPTDCTCRGRRGGALVSVRMLLAEVAILRDAIAEQSQRRTVRFKISTMQRGADEKSARVREILADLPACGCQS